MIVRGLNQVSDLTKELAIYVLHMLHNENLIIRKVYSLGPGTVPKQVTRSTSSWRIVQPKEPMSFLAPPLVAARTVDVEEGQQQRRFRRLTRGQR